MNEAYFRIESLKEYWVIDPDRVHVRQYVRLGEGVLVRLFQEAEDQIISTELNLTLSVSDIYRRIQVA